MKNLFDVTGKTVLVTGGSRGIGKMMAEAFVRNGSRVYISSRSAEACEQAVTELTAYGQCVSLPFDLSTVDGATQLASALAAKEEHLDILVNNAGAAWGAELDVFPESGWDKTMNLNLKGVFFLTQKLLPLLRQAASREGTARVINIASIDGLNPPASNAFAYSASKAGCIMMTKHLAKNLVSEGILVNAIAPGPFLTKMTAHFLSDSDAKEIAENPMRRVGSPEDIAGVALFLASRASAYTTGAVIPCDGGYAALR